MYYKNYLSVIVIAHDRKTFLLEAVDSVFSQTLKRSAFEIIVIKNFEDESIDRYLAKKEIKVINTHEVNLGSKCVIGIQASRGNILSFLEDDDIYLPEKLENTLLKFEDDDLSYYHNNFIISNEVGGILEKNLFKHQTKSHKFKIGKVNIRSLRKYINEGIYFNLSCLAIRVEIIKPYLNQLKSVSIATDNFMFYVALDSGKTIFSDHNKFTRYRLHNSNESFRLETSKQLAIDKTKSFLRRDIIGYETILSICKDSTVREIVECRVLAPKINFRLLNGKDDALRWKDCFHGLKCAVKLHNKQLLLLALLEIFLGNSSNLTQSIYSLYLSRVSKKFRK